MIRDDKEERMILIDLDNYHRGFDAGLKSNRNPSTGGYIFAGFTRFIH
jgi:hypothetical protein